MEVTVSSGTGAYVRHGREAHWQPPTSTVRVDGVPRIVVTGTRSELVLSSGTVDVSEDVPAAIADDHAAIAAWWSAEVERQEAEADGLRLEAAGDDTIRRLAAKAREHGVQLRQDRTGRYFASSVSQPGTWHYVTGISCTCLGFHRHQRCMHNSALLVALGWVPIDPTPEPVSIAGTRHAQDQVAA